MIHPEEKRVVENIVYDLKNSLDFELDREYEDQFDLVNEAQNIKIRVRKFLYWPKIKSPFDFNFSFFNALRLSRLIKKYRKKIKKIEKLEKRNKNLKKMVGIYTSRRKDGSLFVYDKREC